MRSKRKGYSPASDFVQVPSAINESFPAKEDCMTKYPSQLSARMLSVLSRIALSKKTGVNAVAKRGEKKMSSLCHSDKCAKFFVSGKQRKCAGSKNAGDRRFVKPRLTVKG